MAPVFVRRDLGCDGNGGDLKVGGADGVELREFSLAGPVTQTADLQGLRRLDEGGKHLLGHVGLPLVHVLHQALQVIEIHILHDNHGRLVIEE